MVSYKRLFITVILACASGVLVAQSSKETEIRGMEQMEKEAILQLDTTTMEKLWDKDLVVNSPTNNVVDKRGGMFALKNGFIHYASYEKEIEKIMFYGDVSIVMGLETVKPIGLAPNIGKTVKRRFTNIWRQQGKSWTLVARQATNISIE
jgi:hypothetical protein